SGLSVQRWKRLAGLGRRESGVQAFSPTAKTLAQGRIHSARASEILRGPRAVHRTVRGRIQRGGRSPLIGRCGGWFLGGGHSRKCPPPMRPFGYFSGEGKVPRGMGLEAPKSLRHGGGYPIPVQYTLPAKKFSPSAC